MEPKVWDTPGAGPVVQLTLGFSLAAEVTTKKRKLGKNPDVDTSFLPDRDREVKGPGPPPWQRPWF